MVISISTTTKPKDYVPCRYRQKNWLFAGSDKGGKRAATIYSILETCKQNGINTFDYFKDVLTRLPSAKQADIKNFTPYNWLPT